MEARAGGVVIGLSGLPNHAHKGAAAVARAKDSPHVQALHHDHVSFLLTRQRVGPASKTLACDKRGFFLGDLRFVAIAALQRSRLFLPLEPARNFKEPKYSGSSTI